MDDVYVLQAIIYKNIEIIKLLIEFIPMKNKKY